MKKLKSRLNQTAKAAILLASLQVAMPAVMLAQTQPAQPINPVRSDLKGKTVESVRVLGNETVSSAVVLNQVRTHEGDAYDPATVAEDYQRIFGLKKFSNVEAQVEPIDRGGVVVVFVVTEQKQIKLISYRGNVGLDTITVQGVVDLHVGEAVDRFRIAIAKQSIQNLYKDRNYPFAHVDVDADALAQRGEVIFNIVEGPNVKIRNIRFVGAHSFTNSKLRDQIQTKSWIFVFRHGNYDPDLLDDDVASLRKFYENKGFFDCRVGRKLIWSPDLRELQIDFVVDEGVRYQVDRVTFKGNSSVSEADLRHDLKLVEGIDYDNDLVQRDIRTMVKSFSPFGFIYQPGSSDPNYLKIDSHPVFRSEPGHVELVYDISEGRPFRLGQIIPRGNTRTMDKVILREMHLTPGQLYNSSEVADSVDRLKGRPYFSKVTATPIGDDPASRDLLVEVEENKTASFSVGGGINSNGGVGGNLTYEQKNFDIGDYPESWKDVFSDRAFIGAGQDFLATFEPGTINTNASVRFTEPYIFDQPYSLTTEIYLRNHIREDYDDERVGGRITLGKRFNEIYTGSVTARGELVDINHIRDKEVRAFEILDAEGQSTLTSLGLRLSRDTTTRGILPAKGTTTVGGVEFFGALGGDYTFEKFTISHDRYYTLHEDLLDRRVILNLHGDAGYLTGGTPFFERFYGGGIGSIRGFQFRGVSPRSGPEDDRVGGDFEYTGSAEVSFPLAGESFRGVVFTDIGDVERDFSVGTIRSSIGTGIRLTLPILGQAPIALDFAIPVSKDSQDDVQYISFSLGFVR